jgi:hypothetical protein
MLPGNLRTKNFGYLYYVDYVLPPLMIVGPVQNFSKDQRRWQVRRNRESE